MNAIRQFVTPTTDFLEMSVRLPNELKAKRLEIIIMAADELLEPTKTKGLLAKQRGLFKNMPDTEKTKILSDLDNLRNEWERNI